MSKSTAPVVLEKPYHVGWPGFSGPSIWGPLFLMKWPESHPDTHCEDHVYTPDEKGICGCGWVPADKVCCETCNELVRLKLERLLLKRMVHKSPYSPDSLVIAAYLGYLDEYRDKLDSTPDLSAVYEWFQGMPREKRNAIKEKYEPGLELGDMLLADLLASLLD